MYSFDPCFSTKAHDVEFWDTCHLWSMPTQTPPESTLAIRFWRIIVTCPRMLSTQFVVLYRPCKLYSMPKGCAVELRQHPRRVGCLDITWRELISQSLGATARSFRRQDGVNADVRFEKFLPARASLRPPISLKFTTGKHGGMVHIASKRQTRAFPRFCTIIPEKFAARRR